MIKTETLSTQHEPIPIGSTVAFTDLVKERKRLAYGLSGFVLVVYYVFVYVVAFQPEWLARRIGDTAISVGLLVAAGMFVVFTLFTAYYAFQANRRFDDLTRRAIEETKV